MSIRIEKRKEWLWRLWLVFFLAWGILTISRANVQAASRRASINVTDISLAVGKTRQLKVSNARNVRWSSSNRSVVTVSKNGRIKARKAGSATITARYTGGKLTCRVTVGNSQTKVLVVYFSHTGTTRTVANRIKRITGGDILRIRERNRYTSYYDSLTEQAQRELNRDSRPRITTEARNIRSYDTIYIGYPIWWGSSPRVVNTFLEKYNLRGKTVIPFATSGGSDISGSLDDVKKSAAGATFKDGYTADRGSYSEIRRWLKSIGELGSSGAATPTPTSAPASTTTPAPTAAPTTAPTPTAAPAPTATPVPTAAPTQTPSTASHILVAYFSWSGTSQRIAQNIVSQTGADIFRIDRATPYSTDYTTLGYGDAKTEADTNARPPLKDPLPSVAQYDKIILCYPIWWHTAPMTVGTFLESYDMTGKTIYPVSQSASMDTSQYQTSVEFIRSCARGATVDGGIFSKDSTAIRNYISGTVLA